MIIACPACGTRYAVPDSAIGLDGRTVRCAKCRHSWFQEGPELAGTAARQAEPAPAVAATPPSRPSVVSPPSAPVAQDATPPAPSVARTPSSFREPAAPVDEALPPPPPAPAPRRADRAPGGYYDNAASFSEPPSSSFDYAPPFRARRNWTKIATWSAGAFAAVTLGLAGAVAYGGLPDWVPIPHATFQQAQPDLKLDFPRNRQDRKPLPDGTEFFSVSGTISNIGAETRRVPSLLVVLRNQRETIVYEKEIAPSKRELAPGETITVNEALTDIPRAAASAEIGWKPD